MRTVKRGSTLRSGASSSAQRATTQRRGATSVTSRAWWIEHHQLLSCPLPRGTRPRATTSAKQTAATEWGMPLRACDRARPRPAQVAAGGGSPFATLPDPWQRSAGCHRSNEAHPARRCRAPATVDRTRSGSLPFRAPRWSGVWSRRALSHFRSVQRHGCLLRRGSGIADNDGYQARRRRPPGRDEPSRSTGPTAPPAWIRSSPPRSRRSGQVRQPSWLPPAHPPAAPWTPSEPMPAPAGTVAPTKPAQLLHEQEVRAVQLELFLLSARRDLPHFPSLAHQQTAIPPAPEGGGANLAPP